MRIRQLLGERRLVKRSMKLARFENNGAALLRRKRLRIRYYSRGKDEENEREISPRRLVR